MLTIYTFIISWKIKSPLLEIISPELDQENL